MKKTKKGKKQNQEDNVMSDISITDLMRDYLDIFNRAIDKNAENFWYEKAIQLNNAIWDNPYFRVSIYDKDPDRILEECIVHFSTYNNRLSLSHSVHEVEFSCKVPLSYLEDVRNRPEWYIHNPLMLDWKWFTDRISTGSQTLFQNNKYLTIGLGLIIGTLLTVFLVRKSSKRE